MEGGFVLEDHIDVHGEGEGALSGQLNVGQIPACGVDAVDGDIGHLVGFNPLVHVPVEHHAGFLFGDAQEIFGARMLEGPLVFVALHGGPKGLLADDASKLHEEERAFHVGGHLVGEFAVEVVGEGAGGLHPVFVGDASVAAEVAEVGIREVFTRNDIHRLVLRKAGKALIHPIVALLVGAKHAVKPHVGGLVDDGAEQAVVAAVDLQQRSHGVFHGTFPALNDAELGPVVAAKMVVHEGEIGLHVGL